MVIGQVIYSWRQKHDIGVREMGQRLGLSHGTVSRIERGGQVDAETMLKLVNWLFSGTNGTRKGRGK
jgi:transcriptional regulator with XRE-family HTH domain